MEYAALLSTFDRSWSVDFSNWHQNIPRLAHSALHCNCTQRGMDMSLTCPWSACALTEEGVGSRSFSQLYGTSIMPNYAPGNHRSLELGTSLPAIDIPQGGGLDEGQMYHKDNRGTPTSLGKLAISVFRRSQIPCSLAQFGMRTETSTGRLPALCPFSVDRRECAQWSHGSSTCTYRCGV